MKTTKIQPGVRVLHKTLDILETIKSEEVALGLSKLARRVQLPKATVYRIAATLKARGYIGRNEGGGYFVAKKLFDIAEGRIL